MKNNRILSLILLLLTVAFAEVGIGTSNPNSNAILDLTATNKAFLIHRLANTGAIAVPVNGMMIYDMSSNCFKAFENNSWSDCLSIGSGSSTNASVMANCGTGFVGNFINGIPLTTSASCQETIANNALSTTNSPFY